MYKITAKKASSPCTIHTSIVIIISSVKTMIIQKIGDQTVAGNRETDQMSH